MAGPTGGNQPAYVVTRPEPGLPGLLPGGADYRNEVDVRLGGSTDSAHVVVRSVVDRTLTVDRELSMQPVRPWLAEVLYANTLTIYVDPYEDYRPDAWRGIDENHSLLRAQRLALTRLALPARVVRNLMVPADEPAAGRWIEPRAIIKLRKPGPEPAEGFKKVVMAE